MKKIFLLFAILLSNSVFIACTDLDDTLENEPVHTETVSTTGEDGQTSDPEKSSSGDGN